MTTGSFMTAILTAAAVTATLAFDALAAGKKTGPATPTPVGSINGVSKLSQQECENAKGIIWERVECDSGNSCALQDENKMWHYICISKK